MSYAPLPTPLIVDPPNVPSDLGKVAKAIETQTLSQYNGYNMSNNPSATSLEGRITAVDAPGTGTAQALDARVTTLNTSITAWTAGSPSNLSTQAARTSAYPARQDSQDSTISSLNVSLAAYEPQIAQLQQQRPGGMIVRHSNNYWTTIGTDAVLIDSATITVTQASHYYRVIFTGTFANASNLDRSPVFSVLFTINAGTTANLFSTVIGGMRKNAPANYVPFSAMGVTTGNPAGQYTIGLYCNMSVQSGYAQGYIGEQSPTLIEDLGYKYF